MKVAIVGSCPSSRLLAPYADRDFEIWACSVDNAGVLPRVTKWFELHGDLGLATPAPWERPYLDWLNQQPFPVFAQITGLFERGIEFPKDILVATFGTHFFTSQPAWMFAYAMHLKASVISLFGLDMSSRHEYMIQRPAMHHFIQLAEARGIEVLAPLESDVLNPPPLYGYDLSTHRGRKLQVREMELRQRMAALDGLIAAKQHERTFLEGALDDLDYHRTIWTGETTETGIDRLLTADSASAKVVNLKGD